jgi:hypothetical protein
MQFANTNLISEVAVVWPIGSGTRLLVLAHCLALNGMALLVMLRPNPSPHVRSFPPTTQDVGFANTTLGSSPSFYADPSTE